MSTRFVASVLVAAVFLFASGGVLFAVVLADYFRHAMGHLVRPPEDFRMGIVILEKLVQAFLLAVLYARVPRTRSTVMHGLAVGMGAGLLLELPWGLSLYGNYPVAASAAVVFATLDFARIVVAVMLIAWVQRVARASGVKPQT